MQLQAYEGYLEDGKFHPIGQPLRKQGRQRAILTLLHEPTKAEKQQARAEWLTRLKQAYEDSIDEELWDLLPQEQMREPHGLTD